MRVGTGRMALVALAAVFTVLLIILILETTGMLREGDQAPDFTAHLTTGETIRLSDFRGSKNVVLSFYPKDFSAWSRRGRSGCPWPGRLSTPSRPARALSNTRRKTPVLSCRPILLTGSGPAASRRDLSSQAVAALNPGEKYGLVEFDWGAFIIRCDERTPISKLEPAGFAEQRRTKVAQNLMGELLKPPEVKDYRDALAY